MTASLTDHRPDELHADAIERDVRRTQDRMGETIERLEDRLEPREIGRSVLGDDGSEVAKDAIEVTRQNPIPVALIAIGLIWLLAGSRSPGIRRMTDRIRGKGRMDLRPRSEEPAPIGPPPPAGEMFDRRPAETGRY